MNATQSIRSAWPDFLAAVQFLTRIRVPVRPYDPRSLSRAVKFFPVVGLLIGAAAALLNGLLVPHLPRLLAALLVVIFLVLITGCLHEDGLADTADAFGGGQSRERILLILKDSRIGSYGGVALLLSLLARVLLLAALPLNQVTQYLIAAHVLCRWTTLPMSYYLAPARTNTESAGAGLGASIANLTTRTTLVMGTAFSFAVVAVLLRSHAIAAISETILIAILSGLYYKRRIGGVTGDCFGATNQLTEIFVYLAGAWIA